MIAKNIVYNGSKIHYNIYGQGAAVILLHGFAEDSRIWDSFVEELAKDYKIILPDIPGSGASQLLKGSHINISDYAEVMNEILKEESTDKCCMIGHSMGGYIALAFAEKYSYKLSGLGLFHSSAYADDEAKIETRRKGIEFIKTNGPLTFLKTSIPGLFANADKSKDDISLLIERAKEFSAEALVQYYEAMIARPDRTFVLKESNYPVLFIMGRHDKAVPFEHSLQQSHLPHLSYINILENSAHMGMLEEKDKSFAAVIQFLQSIYVLQ